MTIADAVPDEVGERFPDPDRAVSKTLTDGQPREFIETVGQDRIRQVSSRFVRPRTQS